MGPKQREMDGVVRTIHETIERQDKERAARGEKPTLLVLLGDHAMNEIGNHGGSSRLETSTVFVFVGQGVGATPVDGRGALEALMETEVQQSSLVPTLALLFGIPIPKNNLGLPLPALLDGYAEHERLHMLQTAAAQIYAVARANDRTARAVSQQVVARDARRLASAADCDGQGAIGSTLQCKYEAALAAHRQAAQGRMTSIQAERAYYAFMEHASEHLSRAAGNYGLGAMTAGMAAMAAAAAGLALLYQRGCTGLVRPSGRLAVGWPAAALWATYLLSLSSSSLIEEEHQFWYFWVQTLLALRLLTSSGRGGALRTLLQMATFRVVRAWNQTGQKWAGEHDIRRSLIDPQNACVLWALAAAALVPVNVWAAHRLRWHRGALWPRVSRGLLAYGSACALLYHMDRAQAWAVLGAGEPLVRAARGLAPSDPLLLARTVFATALLQVAVCCATLRSAGLAHAAEAALAGAMPVFLLLARPHSFGVFGLFFVILALFPPGGDGTRGWLRPPIALVLFGLAHASFFALGNSNSLASLDLSNAYAGVAQYDEVQVGLLVFLANWAGPLWWALAAAAVLAQEHSTVDRLAPRLAELAVAAHLWQATALLMLSAVATLLRSHLFVWSVFSPRYLYQVAWLVAFYLGSGTVGGAVG
ncbi:major facilitator super transporter protein, partial [Coemansia biformis]